MASGEEGEDPEAQPQAGRLGGEKNLRLENPARASGKPSADTYPGANISHISHRRSKDKHEVGEAYPFGLVFPSFRHSEVSHVSLS